MKFGSHYHINRLEKLNLKSKHVNITIKGTSAPLGLGGGVSAAMKTNRAHFGYDNMPSGDGENTATPVSNGIDRFGNAAGQLAALYVLNQMRSQPRQPDPQGMIAQVTEQSTVEMPNEIPLSEELIPIQIPADPVEAAQIRQTANEITNMTMQNYPFSQEQYSYLYNGLGQLVGYSSQNPAMVNTALASFVSRTLPFLSYFMNVRRLSISSALPLIYGPETSRAILHSGIQRIVNALQDYTVQPNMDFLQGFSMQPGPFVFGLFDQALLDGGDDSFLPGPAMSTGTPASGQLIGRSLVQSMIDVIHGQAQAALSS